MTVQLQALFHVMEDVCVPATNEFGYVFAISEEENMLMVKSFDGKHDGWYHPGELEHLTLEAAQHVIKDGHDKLRFFLDGRRK